MGKPGKTPAPIKEKIGRKRGPAKGTAGRPRIELDWPAIEKLAGIHCTQVEIAAVAGVGIDTLNQKSKAKWGKTFQEYLREKRGLGNTTLRRKQYLLAEAGDKTMLVWLGKNWLGQSDKLETKEESTTKIEIQTGDLKKLTTEELRVYVALREKINSDA